MLVLTWIKPCAEKNDNAKNVLFLIKFKGLKNIIYIKCKQSKIFDGFSTK